MRYSKGYSVLFSLLLVGPILLFCADWLWPLELPQSQAASVVLDRYGQPLRHFADPDGIWRHHVRLVDVSPFYIEALINYEDRYFYQHLGVNPFSLVRATWQYVNNGRVISGGSTLTMQVARILHPHRRTLLGKSAQILRALQLEWHLSKEQILELYLNHAPFGGVIEGVQAASYRYLRKPVKNLRRSEAALLAVLPQAPSRLRPDRFPQRAETARNKVLNRLAEQGIWGLDDIQTAAEEDVKSLHYSSPLHAPILSRRLRNEYQGRAVIHTTLDLELQRLISKQIKSYTENMGEHISAGVVLVDNRNQDVLAYVASSDFLSKTRAGQVDMVKAIRSPGSTLKPLLYGMAIDAELIHSESLLADVPRVIGQYRPENFASIFNGPVSASEALQRSLNLPFVQLIDAYGPQKFINKLDHVGFPITLPKGQVSSAVILGGGGTTLEGLVALYSGLAHAGTVRPLNYLKDKKRRNGRGLMSSQSAWVTWNTLKGVQPPKGFRWGVSRELQGLIGWKTGTSWGHRDNWAIGVSKNFTLGVWLGRPDGRPMKKEYVGASTAGPLLFKLFRQIEHSRAGIDKPNGVEQVNICWPDGRRYELVDFCEETRLAFTKEGVTPRTLSIENSVKFFNPVMPIHVDLQSNERVPPSCLIGHSRLKKVYLWPSALEFWLAGDRRRSQRIPPFKESCTTHEARSGHLRIIGIKPGQIYKLNKLDQVKLKFRVEGAAGKVYWYLNGRSLGKDDILMQLQLNGRVTEQNELVVLDEQGGVGRVTFRLL